MDRRAESPAAHRRSPGESIGSWAPAALAALGLGAAALAFTGHREIASLADDSGTYLVMAQRFAAPLAPDPVAAALYREETYPPLFPLLLAAAGAGEDPLRAHSVVAATFVLACLLLLRLARAELSTATAAAGCLIVFASMPGAWVNLLGILSENLYLACSLAALLAHRRWCEGGCRNARGALLTGAAIALAALTRGVGLVLVLAYLGWLGLAPGRPRVPPVLAAIPAALGLAAWAAWAVLRPDVEATYLHQFLVRYRAVLDSPDHHPVTYLAETAVAAASAWLASLMVYWRGALEPRVALAAALGVLALGGTLLRARRGAFDALYVLAYLGVVIAWPYRGEMHRFVYPVLPLLALHALWAARAIGTRLAGDAGAARAALLVVPVFLAVSAPALAFVAGRATYEVDGQPYRYRHVAEFYRIPDLGTARAFADRMGALVEALRRVRETTPEGAVVLWVKPNFMALLGGRRGVTTPPAGDEPAFLAAVRASGAGHALVSIATARNNEDGLRAWPAFAPFTREVWRARAPEGGGPVAVLLAIDHARLDALAGEARDP